MPTISMKIIAAPGGTRINQELMDRLRSSTTGSKHNSTHLQRCPSARSFSSRSPRYVISAGKPRPVPPSRIHQKTVQDCLFLFYAPIGVSDFAHGKIAATSSSVGGFWPPTSLQVP